MCIRVSLAMKISMLRFWNLRTKIRNWSLTGRQLLPWILSLVADSWTSCLYVVDCYYGYRCSYRRIAPFAYSDDDRDIWHAEKTDLWQESNDDDYDRQLITPLITRRLQYSIFRQKLELVASCSLCRVVACDVTGIITNSTFLATIGWRRLMFKLLKWKSSTVLDTKSRKISETAYPST